MTDKYEFIVLPDLDKKIDEAVHDAINHFHKKCPYCDSLLFTGHIRNKIQIDHYIPISRGGQHVPWNILPVCQRCNSKKLAKKPKLFLTTEKLDVCENYLKNVALKYIGQVQTDLEKYQQIKSLIVGFHDLELMNQNKTEIVKTIYEIVTEKSFKLVPFKTTTDFNVEMEIQESISKFFRVPLKTDIIEKFSATELHKLIQPKLNFSITRTQLSKAFKKMGFYVRLERTGPYQSKRAFYVTIIDTYITAPNSGQKVRRADEVIGQR